MNLKVIKQLKYFLLFFLTLLLGIQTSYAKNKLLLPKTKVSFLIESNTKNIFDTTITLDIQLKKASSVRIRSTLLEELKDSNNKTVYRIVFVNDKKSLTNLTNTLTENRKKVLNALKNGKIKNVVAKGNNAAEHLNINGKTIDIVDAEIRSLDVNGKIISKKVAGKLANKVNDVGTYTTKIRWGILDVDARPFGKGYWGKRTVQNKPRVDAYELKINPNNESFYIEHPNGGFVQFENLSANALQDGKMILQPNNSFYHVYDKPPFLRQKVLNEAIRQVEAAGAKNLTVEWLVSDQKALTQLTQYFSENNVNIVVKFLAE